MTMDCDHDFLHFLPKTQQLFFASGKNGSYPRQRHNPNVISHILLADHPIPLSIIESKILITLILQGIFKLYLT